MPCPLFRLESDSIHCATALGFQYRRHIGQCSCRRLLGCFGALPLSLHAVGRSPSLDANGGLSFTLDLGPWTRGLVTRIRVYPRPGDFAKLVGASVQASVTGAAYDVLQVMDATVGDGWNEYDVSPGSTPTQRTPYRYARLAVGSTGVPLVAW
jgi:hypothetical protein